jgi:uncharacterized membrane protein
MEMWPGVLWTVVGVLLALVGWFASRGRLPRGHWAGLRSSSTMASEESWDAGNRGCGPWLLGGGALTALVGVLILLANPDADTVAVISIVLVFSLLVAIVGGVAIGISAARAVRALQEPLAK